MPYSFSSGQAERLRGIHACHLTKNLRDRKGRSAPRLQAAFRSKPATSRGPWDNVVRRIIRRGTPGRGKENLCDASWGIIRGKGQEVEVMKGWFSSRACDSHGDGRHSLAGRRAGGSSLTIDRRYEQPKNVGGAAGGVRLKKPGGEFFFWKGFGRGTMLGERKKKTGRKRSTKLRSQKSEVNHHAQATGVGRQMPEEGRRSFPTA